MIGRTPCAASAPRLLGGAPPVWRGRVHFFAVAARQMRRILVDHARARATGKRGGEAPRVTLDEDRVGEHQERAFEVLLVDEALRELAVHDERKARVIELRYFAGMTLEEAAAALVQQVSDHWGLHGAVFAALRSGRFSPRTER